VDLLLFAADLRFGWMGMRGMIRRRDAVVTSAARSDETPRRLPNQSEALASVKPDATEIAGTIFEPPQAGPKGESQGRIE
jgi:hypothetical protein